MGDAQDLGRQVWTRHTGLSRERHEEIGPRLKQIREELIRLQIEAETAYPRTDRCAFKAQRALQRAIDRLDVARCELENLYARQHPDTWTTKTYYGGNSKNDR